MPGLQANIAELDRCLDRLRGAGIANRIGGHDRESQRGATFETASPVDGTTICRVARSGAGDIEAAATIAREAFPAWRDMPAPDRSSVLHRVADLIAARAREIALCESWDTGQPIRFMSKAAIRGAENFRFFADRAVAARDGQLLPSETLMNVTTRVPIGPIGVITPWNTPFMLSTWKIAPALAAGCTVVHKPAELAPITARILVEIAEEAGLPPGVWNLVNGFGEEAGRALTEHPHIKAIGFVGESRTGSMIMRQGAETLKRVHFELGGKNPVVVFDDADLDRALDAAIFMIYSLNGERCTSSSRLLIQSTIAPEFLERLVERVNRIRVGHPLDPGTEVGPLIHEVQPREGPVLFRDRAAGRRHDRGWRLPDRHGGKLRASDALHRREAGHANCPGRDFRPGPDLDYLWVRRGSAGNRQRCSIRARGICLDQRSFPRTAFQQRSRGWNDLGEFRERPSSADPIWRRQGQRHRPRWRRLVLRVLHGAETHRSCSGEAPYTQTWHEFRVLMGLPPMPVPTPNLNPPFNIVRVSHVEFGVRDLAASRAFYVDTLGLQVTHEDAGSLYLRAMEERGHHCIALRQADESDVRVLGFKVFGEVDLERAEGLFQSRGLPADWVERPFLGRTLRTRDGSGIPLEFYSEMTRLEPIHQRFSLYSGARALRIDHVNLFSPDVDTAVAFYGDLGFRLTEYTEDERSKRLWAAWMHRKGGVHDVAFTNGVGPRLHHIALWVSNPMDIINLLDLMATTGYLSSIERGPGRHGISNAFFLYVRDPDGNRVEFYCSDYQTVDPDHEPIRWDLGDPQRQTLWGAPAPRSWFEEGSRFEGVEPTNPILSAQPIIAP